MLFESNHKNSLSVRIQLRPAFTAHSHYTDCPEFQSKFLRGFNELTLESYEEQICFPGSSSRGTSFRQFSNWQDAALSLIPLTFNSVHPQHYPPTPAPLISSVLSSCRAEKSGDKHVCSKSFTSNGGPPPAKGFRNGYFCCKYPANLTFIFLP